MRQILGSGLFLIGQILGDLRDNCEINSGLVKHNEPAMTNFDTLLKQLRQSEMKVSLNIAETLYQTINREDSAVHSDYLKTQLVAISEASWAELRTMLFFRMDEELRKYFEQSNLYGEVVAIKFPSASLDIEEAGKCLALGRPTAAVFHLMRVMELGLHILGNEMGIDYAPSWDSYISKIEAKIGEKHANKSNEWKAIEPFFKELLGNLVSIKIAWRNPTMHIDRNYTSNEAEDIFRAVRNFMQRLAEKFSQVAQSG